MYKFHNHCWQTSEPSKGINSATSFYCNSQTHVHSQFKLVCVRLMQWKALHATRAVHHPRRRLVRPIFLGINKFSLIYAA